MPTSKVRGIGGVEPLPLATGIAAESQKHVIPIGGDHLRLVLTVTKLGQLRPCVVSTAENLKIQPKTQS